MTEGIAIGIFIELVHLLQVLHQVIRVREKKILKIICYLKYVCRVICTGFFQHCLIPIRKFRTQINMGIRGQNLHIGFHI